MPIQKNTNNQLIVQTLYKEYCLCYSPLLLPKIAKYGFNITGGSKFASFITKIKLYDLATIDKENKVLSLVKIKINHMSKNNDHNQNIEKEKVLNLKQQKSLIRNLSTKFHQIPRNSISRKSHQLQKSTHKYKWLDMMTTYQQLYEFVKILLNRSKDLQDLIAIIQPKTQNVEVLQKFSSIIQNNIYKARQIIQQIFPQQARRSLQVQDDKRSSAFFKIKKQKMTLYTDKATQQSDNNDFSALNDSNENDKRLKTEQSAQQSTKFKFLKRKTSKNLLTQLIQNQNAKTKKRSRFQSSILKINRTIPSDRPQKSFKMNNDNNKDDTISRNTQQRFDDDLQKQHEQILLNVKAQSKKEIKSQREFVDSLVAKEKNLMKTLKNLNPDSFLYRQLNAKRKRDTEIILIQHEDDINQKSKNLVAQPLIRQRASDIVKPMKRSSQRNSQQINLQVKQRKSFLGQSRSSITTQNSHSYKKSQFNIGGKNKRNTRDLMNSQQSEQVIESKNFLKQQGNKKRKLRTGAIKHDQLRFNDSSRTLSIAQQTHSKDHTQKGNRNRRTGKQLPPQMNKNFQRLIQDQNITKMIQANQQKDHNRHVQNDSKRRLNNSSSKNHFSGKLKRIKSGTQTSIAFNLPSSRQIPQNIEKRNFRISKQKNTETQKQNFTANYSDLLALQKNLRPIAAYNESKMVTRYSMVGGEGDTNNFQFRFKNGKFLFNHEFYLRKQQQNRVEDAQQMIERRKSLRKESMKFEFMSKFKRRLQEHNEPVQRGYDDSNSTSQKFINDQRQKIRMGMIV